MKTVRNNVFETNSSSMHALVIPRTFEPVEVTEPIAFDYGNADFSMRHYEKHDTPSAKASYCMIFIIETVQSMLKCIYDKEHWDYFDETKRKKLSAEDINHNDEVMSKFMQFLDKIAEEIKKEYSVDIKFTNFTLDVDTGIIKPPKHAYVSAGCYGNEAFKETVMHYILRDLEQFMNSSGDVWWIVSHMIEFIMDPRAVILQGSDEMDEDEQKKQTDAVVEYVLKNNGDCTVSWPAGG